MKYDEEVALNVAKLLANLADLKPKDKSFATDLLAAYAAGKATVKQKHWLGVMAQRAENKGVDPGKPESTTIALGGFQGVYVLFAVAKASKLKHPKIKLAMPTYMSGEQIGDGQYKEVKKGGQNLELYVAGDKSKYAGQIMVTDGEAYGKNKWYGSISKEGEFKPGFAFSKEEQYVKNDMLKLLKDLAEKPAEVASMYGKQTGHCCFCALQLTDPKSVAVGYGPICASHYGLPWGDEGSGNGKGGGGVSLLKIKNKLPGGGSMHYDVQHKVKIETVVIGPPKPVEAVKENPKFDPPAPAKREYLF